MTRLSRLLRLASLSRSPAHAIARLLPFAGSCADCGSAAAAALPLRRGNAARTQLHALSHQHIDKADRVRSLSSLRPALAACDCILPLARTICAAIVAARVLVSLSRTHAQLERALLSYSLARSLSLYLSLDSFVRSRALCAVIDTLSDSSSRLARQLCILYL